LEKPSYRNMGDHTETVQIEFDPEATSYKNLLKLFWKNHDPTSKCYSRQYMSAIFYHSTEQKRLAEESLQAEEKKRKKIIQTKILPLEKFYNAEDYHQKYLLQRYPHLLAKMDIEPGDEMINSFVATRLNGYLGGYGSVKSLKEELEQLALSPNVEALVCGIVRNY